MLSYMVGDIPQSWATLGGATVLLAIATLVSLVLTIYGGPGTWLMLAATAGYIWWMGTSGVWWVVAVMTAIALAAEVLEFAAVARSARKRGGSRRAAWGALIGGIVGAIALSVPVPVIGTILGAAIGCCAGGFIMELSVRGDMQHSAAVGVAAGWGRVLATLLKLLAALVETLGVVYVMVVAIARQGR